MLALCIVVNLSIKSRDLFNEEGQLISKSSPRDHNSVVMLTSVFFSVDVVISTLICVCCIQFAEIVNMINVVYPGLAKPKAVKNIQQDPAAYQILSLSILCYRMVLVCSNQLCCVLCVCVWRRRWGYLLHLPLQLKSRVHVL